MLLRQASLAQRASLRSTQTRAKGLIQQVICRMPGRRSSSAPSMLPLVPSLPVLQSSSSSSTRRSQ